MYIYELITRDTPIEEITFERAHREMEAELLIGQIQARVEAAPFIGSGLIDGSPTTRFDQARSISYFEAGAHVHDLHVSDKAEEAVVLLGVAETIADERAERLLTSLLEFSNEDEATDWIDTHHPGMQQLLGIAGGVEKARQEIARDAA